MFFSIIIPTFNSVHTIKRCLKSVVNQTFKCFEVIVVDGYSSDDTIKVVQSFKDSRVRIISSIDNGTYDAMNIGIRFAFGKWLFFLGSDDEIHSNNILNQVYCHIQQCRRADVVYGNVYVKGNTDWAKDNTIYAGKFDLSKVLKQNICHQAIFYKKQIFDKLGYYNIKYNVCADWDFNLRAWSKYRFSFLNLIISIFHAGQTSSNNNKDRNFGKDKWKNTIRYFRWKILRKEFLIYDSHIYFDNEDRTTAFVIFTFKYIYKPLSVIFQKLLNETKS